MNNSIRIAWMGLLVCLLLSQISVAQPPAGRMTGVPTEEQRLAYVLGPNDQIVVQAPVAQEINDKTFSIDSQGNVAFPVIDSVKAGGLTIHQLEEELAKRLSAYYRSPQVRVSALQYRIGSVSLMGAFQKPGVYPLEGQHNVSEMIALAGGLLPTASPQLMLVRRLEQGRIPLPSATENKDQGSSAAEINLTRLMGTANPAEDVVLKPGDVIRAHLREEEMIYVQGAKSGAFPLGDKPSLSVLQVISMAGGLPPETKLNKVVVLRPVMDTSRRAELPLDLKSIMAGKANDFPLLANDVLVIPQKSGTSSKLFWTFIPVAIGIAATAAIYAR